MAVIYVGAGCFWCVEAVFSRLQGVEKVESGYMGGHVKNPTYKEVCSGLTGHAEVVKIIYDPAVIPLEIILEVLWTTHDPTTLNRQGADTGTQYRSAIFYTNDNQKEVAELSKNTVASQLWPNPIVTEITEAQTYYPAEEYHQQFYALNANQPYCAFTIPPKINKLELKFKSYLK
jgi:peptide-methionine (S)-S-oxide reductase